MIVLDTNLLLYAYDSNAKEHAKAQAWLQGVLSGSDPVGIPWPSLIGFLRILTHPAVTGGRFSMEQASAIVDEWLELPHVRLLSPSEGHWATLRRVLLESDSRGNITSNAVLAAVTIEHGGVIYTNDRDFARFPGLRWVNPLATG